MVYVPTALVQKYIVGGEKTDMKSLAYDIYHVQFPKLLAEWLDPDKGIDTGTIKLSAAEKDTMQGNFVFNMLTQQYTDIFQGAFNIFNVLNKDVDQVAKMFG